MKKVKKTKLKTKSSAKKRFTVTGTGKVMRRKSGKRHLLEHVSSKTKRNKQGSFAVSKSDMKKVKQLLPGVA
ncbi:50S ribosomal protein L35 [bacterium]|jgi:large subunit ribosomal protein L35|nr:50S ribosomal protein L35 [bacterium]